jgi:hypothetical protein
MENTKKLQIDELENSLVRLKKFYQSNKKVQRKILKNKSDCKIIVIIRDIVLNLLKGNINLTDREKNKLQKHKYTLRKLIDTNPLCKSREIIVQKGGFLSVLIPSAITLITSILEVLNKT